MNDIWFLFLFIREEFIDYGVLDILLRKMCVKGGFKDVEGIGNFVLFIKLFKK